MLFVCYPKCTTCKKALKWLHENGIQVQVRNIKEEPPCAKELAAWQKMSGLEWKRFFNTSGLLYKELQLKDKLPEMTGKEQLSLLATDGMLVKRPILVTQDKVYVGFKEKEWQTLLKGRQEDEVGKI